MEHWDGVDTVAMENNISQVATHTSFKLNFLKPSRICLYIFLGLFFEFGPEIYAGFKRISCEPSELCGTQNCVVHRLC